VAVDVVLAPENTPAAVEAEIHRCFREYAIPFGGQIN
jgi:hypothetical protein